MAEGEFRININKNFDLKGLREGFALAAQAALKQVAERLLADSRIFVPVLTGQLKDSGYVEQLPTLSAAVVKLQAVYSMPYAEKQHEVEYRHPSLGFFGAALYLEKPLQLFGEFYKELYLFEFNDFVKRNGLLS